MKNRSVDAGRWLYLLGLGLMLFGAGCGQAPDVPEPPRGPARWRRGIAEACTTVTTDPSGRQVQYQFDWGDASQSQWSPRLDPGVPWSDTHSYREPGSYSIRVRARNDRRTSRWSAPLVVMVTGGEGEVLWSFGATGEEPDDSADFSMNTFAIGPDSTVYIGCDYGIMTARRPNGTVWRFRVPDEDPFEAAPTVADDGTIYIGCTNDTLYAINPNNTRRWQAYCGGAVHASAALLGDGGIVVQNEDSGVVCFNPGGTRRWTAALGGGFSSPAVGPDGTIFVATQEGMVYALDPTNGTQKWPRPFQVSSTPVNASLALDATRSVLYVVDDDGRLASVSFAGTGGWSAFVGEGASTPVVGPDGTVYLGGGGKLWAFDNEGNKRWEFVPGLDGVVSPPAVCADGQIIVLVSSGKKRTAGVEIVDSLYSVSPDGSRRWACGLGEGLADVFLSAPKVDGAGLVYVGSGLRAWCVVGSSGLATGYWPTFQNDGRNSGRVR